MAERTFTISSKEYDKYVEWSDKHKCKGAYFGAIGGRESFTFTPTGLGTIIIVKCSLCNEEFDITDNNGW